MPADSPMVLVPQTAEDVKARFGLDPDATGNRPRSWRIVDDAESSDLRGFNGLDIPPGSLAVHTRDGASNPICAEACRLPNFIGTVEDDFDRTYRDYFYAPLSASPARPGEGMGALRAAPSVPTETVIRGLRLIAEHFAVTTPLQRECNVRGWPNMAAATSEVFSQCATEAADRLAALTRSADK